jgi:hypothetical protein
MLMSEPRYIETKINWTMIIVQAVAQIIVLGGLAVGYVTTNEKWKGGVEANIANLAEVNQAQAQINERLRIAIEKLSDSMNLLSQNQERVITLLEYHVGESGQKIPSIKKLQNK